MSVGNQVLPASPQTFFQTLKELDMEPIARQLMHDGWTRQQTMYAISRYLMFLFLVYLHPQMLLVPTQEIDRVWHCHILHTRKYFQDCQRLFGRFIHHEPGSVLRLQADQLSLDAAFAQTTALLECYFPLAVLGDTQLEQLDGLFLAENPPQQQNNSEKGDLRYQSSACGRLSWVDHNCEESYPSVGI
jgi:hypothetical protein